VTGVNWVGEELIRDALRELSDEEFQRESWLSPEMPNSYTEAVCELFDDSALGHALDKGPVFGNLIDDTLREVSRVAARINAERRPEEVINDPLMPELRRLAGQALRALEETYT
jgi:hypothetical protein